MMIINMVDDDDMLAALGAVRADDDDDPAANEAHDDDDLALHLPPVNEGTVPIAKPDDTWIDMGTRAIARSAEGLTIVNTLEVLLPFEFSV